jgi:hypothetical protein
VNHESVHSSGVMSSRIADYECSARSDFNAHRLALVVPTLSRPLHYVVLIANSDLTKPPNRS